jgi:hypothetical protein
MLKLVTSFNLCNNMCMNVCECDQGLMVRAVEHTGKKLSNAHVVCPVCGKGAIMPVETLNVYFGSMIINVEELA